MKNKILKSSDIQEGQDQIVSHDEGADIDVDDAEEEGSIHADGENGQGQFIGGDEGTAYIQQSQSAIEILDGIENYFRELIGLVSVKKDSDSAPKGEGEGEREGDEEGDESERGSEDSHEEYGFLYKARLNNYFISNTELFECMQLSVKRTRHSIECVCKALLREGREEEVQEIVTSILGTYMKTYVESMLSTIGFWRETFETISEISSGAFLRTKRMQSNPSTHQELSRVGGFLLPGMKQGVLCPLKKKEGIPGAQLRAQPMEDEFCVFADHESAPKDPVL